MTQEVINKSICPRKRTGRFYSKGNYKYYMQATEIDVLYPMIKDEKALPAKIEISNFNYLKDDKEEKSREYVSFRMENLGMALGYLASFLIALKEFSRITGIPFDYLYSKIDAIFLGVKKGNYDHMVIDYKGKG